MAALLLTAPGSIASMLLLHFDVVCLVLSTYDFWFFTITSSIACVLLALGLSDARACVTVVLWASNLHSSFVDANTRLICYLIGASAVAAVVNAVAFLAIEVGAVDNWHARVLFAVHGRAVAIDVLILNGLSTLVVLHTRNAYRRHSELREQRKIQCTLLRCINYRSRLRLHCVSTENATAPVRPVRRVLCPDRHGQRPGQRSRVSQVSDNGSADPSAV
ncbi:hypothetical protein PINS_up004784 [Pythium insidiosum]|nr:hypothetical protein PINS_up004784 [Pythium insidiosum]